MADKKIPQATRMDYWTYVGGEVQGKEVGMGKVAGVREAEGSLQWTTR